MDGGDERSNTIGRSVHRRLGLVRPFSVLILEAPPPIVILSGLISVAFSKRRPSTTQIVLGLVATVLLSAPLGYVSPGGPLGQVGSVIVAIIGGVLLYITILAYPWYVDYPKHSKPPVPAP